MNLELENKISKLEKQISRFTYAAWFIILFGFIIAIVGFIISDTPNKENLNNIGDFIGGTTGSLWALGSIFFIYVAFLGQRLEILLQREELVKTQEELRGQKEQLEQQNINFTTQTFETTFFKLLNYHSSNLEKFKIHRRKRNAENKIETSETITGIPAMKSSQRRFENILKRDYKNFEGETKTFITKAIDKYNKEYYDMDLSYYKTFFAFINRIEDSPISDKEFYHNLLRNKLSFLEKVMIFYYSHSQNRKTNQILYRNKYLEAIKHKQYSQDYYFQFLKKTTK